MDANDLQALRDIPLAYHRQRFPVKLLCSSVPSTLQKDRMGKRRPGVDRRTMNDAVTCYVLDMFRDCCL